MKPKRRLVTGWLVLGVALLTIGCATPLYTAVEGGNVQAINAMLDQGTPVDERGPREKTGLIEAARQGNIQLVELLLKRGANVNAKADDLTTALHMAAGNGHTKVAQLLLDRGAEVDARTDIGTTPLTWAAQYGRVEAIELLLSRGADINAKGKNGVGPLRMAVYGMAEHGSHSNALQFLLDRGADINAQDQFGGTALHEAAWRGNLEAARILLQRGASPNERTTTEGYQVTPAEGAREKGHIAVAQLIEQAQAQRLAAAQTIQPSQPVQAMGAVPQVVAPGPSSDVDQPPGTRPAKQNRYAIVIGIEQYRGKLPKADFAAHDAKVMGDYLSKTMGFSEENVAVLVNDQATKTDLEKYLEHWLPNRVEKDSTVFIYYSGHGAPNAKTGDAYLVPYDGDPAFVEATGYPLKRLYQNLGKLPAKEIIVLLDSCFSGAGGRSVIAKGMRPMVLSVENPVLAGGKTVVLAASKGDQVSSTYDQKGHGLLTYYFLKGLRGEADVNRDGSVELAEVYEFLKPQVERTARREYNNDQTPQLLGNVKGVRLVEPAR